MRVSFLREQNGKTARPQFDLQTKGLMLQCCESVNYRVDDDDDNDDDDVL